MDMKRLWIVTLLLCGLMKGLPSPAEEVDRLLAAVNGKVITAGDVELARALYALFSLGKKEVQSSRQEELTGLIELELVRQELENFPLEQGSQSRIQTDVQDKMNDLKEAYAEIGGLPALLRRLGLKEEELVSYVRLRVFLDRFLDLRFRPFVTVSDADVAAYYRETLLPQLQKAGSAAPPLAEVSSKIKEILTEDKVTAEYTQWIENIRNHSRIEYFPVAPQSSEGRRS
jgi:hypothetical protein